jgi:hypothetical protein
MSVGRDVGTKTRRNPGFLIVLGKIGFYLTTTLVVAFCLLVMNADDMELPKDHYLRFLLAPVHRREGHRCGKQKTRFADFLTADEPGHGGRCSVTRTGLATCAPILL